jgi:pilus assembly protein Flp/PilA
VQHKHRDTSEEGATAIEYGLLIALIAGVIITILMILGPQLLPGFQSVIDELN